MDGLTQFLDWLDEAAGGLIRLAYLAAGVTAVAVYFGAGQLPMWFDHPLNAALPWTLAFAVETHTYLTARRVRAAWQDRNRNALSVQVVVLAVLLAFSAWNQLGYLNGVWSPPTHGPLALPTWLAYGVRALIVPCAFMAAAFLAPLAPPIVAQIEGEARATLADVFKIARKQRQRLLKEAETSGRDLTGALVELVTDAETRRIISHAYAAIGAPVAPQPAISPTIGLVEDRSSASSGEPFGRNSAGPDDDPDPDGASLPDEVEDTGEFPAIMGLHAPSRFSGRDGGRLALGDPASSWPGRKMEGKNGLPAPISDADRKRLKRSRQEERKTVIRQMLDEQDAVSVNAVVTALRSRGIGTNAKNAALLLGLARRERIRAVGMSQ